MNTTRLNEAFLHSCFVRNAQFFYISGSVPNDYFVSHIFCCIVNIILALLTTFLNSLTLLTYWKSPRLRKKVAYFVIMILSVADLGVGVVGNPVVVVQLVRELSGTGTCLTSALSDILSTIPIGMSLSVLHVMTFERYIGVLHPIFHRTKVTKQRLFIFTIILWLFFIVKLCLRFYLGEKIYKIVISADLVILAITVLFVYVKIFYTCKKSPRIVHFRRGRKVSMASPSKRDEHALLQNVRQAKTFFLVAICCFLCLIPQAVVTSLATLEGGAILSYWSATIILMNSSVNSLVLFWRNSYLRSEARTVWRKMFNRHQRPEN